MTPEEKEKLKQEIQKQIDSIKWELESLKAKNKPFVSDRAHGRMGRIDAIQSRDFHERGVQSLENQLQGLQKNLHNIDTPDFGICEYCKGPVGDERRKACRKQKCVLNARKIVLKSA